MKSHQLSRKAAVFISVNWVLFFACFAWTSILRGSLLWWRDLNWSGWLEDLAGLTQLTAVPAGTLWIVWLTLACFFTVISWSRKPGIIVPQEANESIAKKQLFGNAEILETHPELKAKILRLHQSLENI